MSILNNKDIPLIQKGVSFNEIPDKTAVYFELGDCNAHCKGCHSPELQEPFRLHDDRYVSINDCMKYADEQLDKGANAIVVLGGTKTYTDFPLIPLLKALGTLAPVCLYSGSDSVQTERMRAVEAGCQWLKVGSYQADKGGLMSKKTNQRFYEIFPCYRKDAYDLIIDKEYDFIDNTYMFWEKRGGKD